MDHQPDQQPPTGSLKHPPSTRNPKPKTIYKAINVQGAIVQATDSVEHQALLNKIEQDKPEIRTAHGPTKRLETLFFKTKNNCQK